MTPNAAHRGAAPAEDDLDTRFSSPLASPRSTHTFDDLDYALQCWAQRLIARTILFADGELDLHTAVDGAWEAADRAGLVAAFGADEVQAAMALAFGSVRC